MGLKCSVLGHTYGEATVEREREEQGSEVVITILERESCTRCGETRIVSENKEVTSIETPSDIAGDMLDDESDAESDDRDAEAEGADEPEPAGVEDDGIESGVAEPVEPVDPDADDAEILDPDDDVDEAESGGDSELEDPSTDVAIPDADGEVEPETDPEEDDGHIIDADEQEDAESEREPGQWPEEAGDDDDDWAPATEPSQETDTQPEPAGGSAVTVPEGKFHCPECDFMTDVASSSLRAGDFCPECHKGALVTDTE